MGAKTPIVGFHVVELALDKRWRGWAKPHGYIKKKKSIYTYIPLKEGMGGVGGHIEYSLCVSLLFSGSSAISSICTPPAAAIKRGGAEGAPGIACSGSVCEANL